jgi:hypothetical protein
MAYHTYHLRYQPCYPGFYHEKSNSGAQKRQAYQPKSGYCSRHIRDDIADTAV